jgi:enterochelin esterase-like enzyme
MFAHAVRRAVPAVVLTLVSAALAPPVLASIVVAREFKSAALGRSWTYAVYLPTGYDAANLRYPALYLLHGSGGNLYQWVNQGRIQQTADALISSGDIPPSVIVLPDGGTSWFVDRKEKMETALITELIPDVEKTFRVLRSREGRLVGGLSMGGYGAMRLALKYPEMFAAAALLSPAIYNPEPPENSAARTAGVFGAPAYDASIWKSLNYPALWEGYLAKKSPVPIYINSGDDDDYFTEFEAVQFYELLRKNKQPAELRIVNGGHGWPVWESTIGDALKYIFRYSARPALATPIR